MATAPGTCVTLRCDNCHAKMAVPAAAAGRSVRCPKCKTKLVVPAQVDAASSNEPSHGADRRETPNETLKVACEHCGKRLRVPAKSAGRRVKCPACSQVFTITAPTPAPTPTVPLDDFASDDDDLLSGLAGGQTVQLSPEEQARRAASAGPTCPSCGAAMFAGVSICGECGRDSSPKPKPQREKSSGGLAPRFSFPNFSGVFQRRISRLWVAAIFMGVAVIVAGVREVKLNSVAQAEPQEISCARLAAEGPGDNAHILLTDFLMCDFYVVEEGSGSTWNRAWTPVVPLDSEYARQSIEMAESDQEVEGGPALPSDIKVVVEFPDATGEHYLAQAANEDTIQGMIVNVVKKLDRETADLISDAYDVDASDCWVLVEGKTPAESSSLWNYFGGGAVLIVFGGVMLLRMAS